MKSAVEHIPGVTFHGRKGAVENAFQYGVDYVLVDAERDQRAPGLFKRNGRGLFSVRDTDHGGAPNEGAGAVWVRNVLYEAGFTDIGCIELLTQPRVLGHVFNPVSFWLIRDPAGDLRAVIAEVTNTYGDRHSYLCRNEGFRRITPRDTIEAEKIFHVSPFQPIAGAYRFRFDISETRIAIRIDFSTGNQGLLATLAGPREPLTNRAILTCLLRRPFGARRVLALIHWQALKLWWKGAVFRSRPIPPSEDVS